MRRLGGPKDDALRRDKQDVLAWARGALPTGRVDVGGAKVAPAVALLDDVDLMVRLVEFVAQPLACREQKVGLRLARVVLTHAPVGVDDERVLHARKGHGTRREEGLDPLERLGKEIERADELAELLEGGGHAGAGVEGGLALGVGEGVREGRAPDVGGVFYPVQDSRAAVDGGVLV